MAAALLSRSGSGVPADETLHRRLRSDELESPREWADRFLRDAVAWSRATRCPGRVELRNNSLLANLMLCVGSPEPHVRI